MEFIVFLTVGYLVGSVPTGVIVAKVMGLGDPRRAGSGNIGATNVARTGGHKAGLITLAGDFAKGFVPSVATTATFGYGWESALVGLACFLGHLYPVFLKFKGGKGVATGAGVLACLAPLQLAVGVALFGIIVYKTRLVSLASISAAAVTPLAATFFSEKPAIIFLTLAVGGLTIWKHSSNIENLVSGVEPKFSDKAEPIDHEDQAKTEGDDVGQK